MKTEEEIRNFRETMRDKMDEINKFDKIAHNERNVGEYLYALAMVTAISWVLEE